jgi:hypothetical protein
MAVVMLFLITFSLSIHSGAAKGNFSKIIIKDLETMNDIVVTDPSLLGFFALSDFKDGTKDSPQVGSGYEITRYFQNDSGDSRPFDRLYYYPSSEGDSGYIFYEGLINGASEYDGKWFQTSLEGEQLMSRFLADQPKPIGMAHAAPPPQSEGQIYIVQTDDWLSKVAEQFYGDVLLWPIIWEATNAKAKEDSAFALIENPDIIEAGQKLWIPNLGEATGITSDIPTEAPPKLDTNFISQQGGFAIWMPAPLERNDDIETKESLGIVVDQHTFFAREGGAYWLVTYTDYPPEIMTKFTPAEILEEAQDNALIESRSRGGLRLEQDISLDGFPGRYIAADSALRDSVRGIYDGTYKARIYLVGNRLYRATTYVFNENWNNRLQTMDDYLASFELLSR